MDLFDVQRCLDSNNIHYTTGSDVIRMYIHGDYIAKLWQVDRGNEWIILTDCGWKKATCEQIEKIINKKLPQTK